MIIPSLCVVVPFGILCLETFHDPHALFTPMDAPGWDFARLPAIDLVGFLPPGDWLHPDTREWNPGIIQNHSWLGLVVCILCGLYASTKSGDPQTRTWAMFSLLPLDWMSMLKWMPMGGVLLPWLYCIFQGLHFDGFIIHTTWYICLDSQYSTRCSGCQRCPNGCGRWLCWQGMEVHTGPVPAPLFGLSFKKMSVLRTRLDFPPDHSTANRTYLIQQLRHREP